MQNSIGPYWFLRLEGQVQVPVQRHAIIARPGVDGESIWKTGVRGAQFQLVSMVDVANAWAANQLYIKYHALVSARVNIVQRGVDFPNVEYEIQNVQPLRIVNNLAAVGGFVNGATLLYCSWNILPVVRFP